MHIHICDKYRVTRYVVNDFKRQIKYDRAIKYLLNCYQRLGKLMQSCVQNITTVRYLLVLYEPT